MGTLKKENHNSIKWFTPKTWKYTHHYDELIKDLENNGFNGAHTHCKNKPPDKETTKYETTFKTRAANTTYKEEQDHETDGKNQNWIHMGLKLLNKTKWHLDPLPQHTSYYCVNIPEAIKITTKMVTPLKMSTIMVLATKIVQVQVQATKILMVIMVLSA